MASYMIMYVLACICIEAQGGSCLVYYGYGIRKDDYTPMAAAEDYCAPDRYLEVFL